MGFEGLFAAIMECVQGLFTDTIFSFVTEIFGQFLPAI